jgi:tetratricopeptide (TPR) repeat protein
VPPLVGRTPELALLEAHLDGAGPPVLLLAGEPGIGKSRLLSEAGRRGAAAGWQVLPAGCTRSGGQLPFAPLLQALQRHISGQAAGARRAALRGCAWLVRLLPELAQGPIEPLPPWTISPEHERRLLFGAVERYLANVAGPAGTLLVLDDLQWAGADALDLLTTLAHTTNAPLRLVGAYRDTEVQPSDPLAVSLADLAHAGLVRHHLLPPLAPTVVHQLLDALLDGIAGDRAALATRIAERSGGVPFFVVGCVQALVRDTADGGEILPWDVAQGIRQRVSALPERVQELLSVASVIGRVVSPALLTAVVEQPEAVVLSALDDLCQARLLSDADASYQFAHDLIREVVEAGMGRGRRLALHRRIGGVLERQAGDLGGELPLAALAYHYGHSDDAEKALLYLEQAGDRAREQAAHAAAVDYYSEAVALLDGLGRALEAARMREKCGAILLTMAHLSRALVVLDEAAEALRRAGDVEGLSRVVAQIGLVHYRKGTLEEGLARLRSQLEALAPVGPSRSLATLSEALAALYQQSGQYAAGLAAAIQSAQAARALGDDRLLARAKFRRGLLLVLMGRAEEALATLQEASALAEAVGQLDVLGWAAQGLAALAEDRGAFDQGRQHASRMLAVGQRLGDPILVRCALFRLAAQAFFNGAWGQAHTHMERVQELPDPSPVNDAAAALELGRLLLAEGAWEQATAYLEECSALARSGGERGLDLVSESLLAERAVLEGRPQAALARLRPLLDRDDMQGRIETIFVLPVLAWIYLELEDTEQATQTITEVLHRQRAGTFRLALVDALRVAALVALRQERWQEAEAALGEGLALARRIGYPYGEARLLQAYGELFAQTGQPEAARERLEEALAIFQRLGARGDVVRAEQVLSSLG